MGLDRRSYDEKRGAVRVPVDCAVALEKAVTGERFTAAGKNLSPGGVLFHTDRLLKRGERLEMRIEAMSPHAGLDATIEVLRVEALPDGRRYAVGGAIRAVRGGPGHAG